MATPACVEWVRDFLAEADARQLFEAAKRSPALQRRETLSIGADGELRLLGLRTHCGAEPDAGFVCSRWARDPDPRRDRVDPGWLARAGFNVFASTTRLLHPRGYHDRSRQGPAAEVAQPTEPASVHLAGFDPPPAKAKRKRKPKATATPEPAARQQEQAAQPAEAPAPAPVPSGITPWGRNRPTRSKAHK